MIKQLYVLNLFIAANCYNILCLLPYTGKSHHMVFEPLLQELTSRGHNLTVLSFFPQEISLPNRRDVSLVGVAPLNVEVVNLTQLQYSLFGFEKYFENIPIVTSLARSNLDLCRRVLDSEQLVEFVKAEGDYDVIITEHFTSDCMLGLIHNYGLPSVGLMSTTILAWTLSRVGASDNPSYVPIMTAELTDRMTLLQRIENTFYLYFYLIWYEVAIRWEEQRIVEKRLGRKLPLLDDIGKNVSVILMNTYHNLNGVKELTPSVVEVGGIHLHNKVAQPLSPDLEKWVSEAESGIILFSFGSLIKGSTLPEKQKRAILNVFARLPQRVVWKWEDKIEDLPDNVMVMKWLPQFDLLNHPKCVAFITHGGLLSLTEAVSVGVPLLMVPVLGDQFGNAAHARVNGVAVVVRLADITEQTFGAALATVLSQEMRSRAKLFRELWYDRPHSAIDTAVYYIEKTARHKGLNLSSEGRWLSRLERALLDIIAFVILIIGTLFYSAWFIWIRRSR